MIEWTLSSSPVGWWLAALFWILTARLCWLNVRRRPGRAAAWLEALRLATVSLILLTLLQPERIERLTQTDTPEIAVLHDASDSMQTRDVLRPEASPARRADWIQQTLATNFHTAWEPRARVHIESFAKPPTNTLSLPTNQPLPGTDLNAALDHARTRYKHLRAVLLLTDGDWNTGANPLQAASRLRAAGVPVYSVTVGEEKPLPDLLLEPVAAPAFGLLGEQISLPLRIRSFLPREVRTTVSLSTDSGLIAQKELLLPPFAQIQETLIWKPARVGDYDLHLQLPVQPEEPLRDNNEQRFRIAIRSQKLQVLVIDSLPRWEYRYLRNALERDPGVDVDCLLFHPGLPVGEGNRYLKTFPTRREDLARYDVVFLGDVGRLDRELSDTNLTLLRGLVEQQGSGLVFLPGRRGRQLSLLQTPLEDLLPVLLNPAQPKGITSGAESPYLLTPSGQAHFLTRLHEQESRNVLLWKNLPGFTWSASVLRPKPGAEVLAVHPSLRNEFGRMPLLATRPFGQGEVLFLGTDSAWRWRRGVEDKYHYRFWGQVVRWMAHKRHMAEGTGLRLAFTPEQPKTGDHVYLQATLLDLAAWNETDRLLARIQNPQGVTEHLELRPVAGGWGVYQAQFQPALGGDYRISLQANRPGFDLETPLHVTAPTLELQGQPARGDVLREIALLTQGQNTTVTKLQELIQQIALLPEPEPLEHRLRLWCHPLWGGTLVLLLAIYWTARKMAGMM